MDKLRLAVVGAGHWGPNLLRNFNDDPRVEVNLICDIDKAAATRIASRYRNLAVCSRLEDIVDNSEIEAVAICTPTMTHYEIAKRCLEKKKHLFIEKPMATTAAECRALNRLAVKQNRKLMVGHVFLYNSAVQYVKNLIERGELGDIIYVYAKRVNLGPIRKDVNALWDLAPHDIAILNYWLGRSPLSVHATGIEHLNPPLHDVVFLSLRYPNNVLASLQVSWLDPRKVRQIVVVGTKKMVVFDDMDPVGPVHIYDKKVSGPPENSFAPVPDTIQAFKAAIQEGDLVIPKIPQGEPLRNECRHFVEWILDGKTPISTGENGLEVVQVLEAATRSLHRSGAETPIETSPGTHAENEICATA